MRAGKFPGGSACGPVHRAFTLVELLVAIAIVALLIGVLIPSVGAARDAARSAATRSLFETIGTAVGQFRNDHGRLPGYYTQNELGAIGRGAIPGNPRFITQPVNALMEMSGGVLPAGSALPSNDPGQEGIGYEARFVRVEVANRPVLLDVVGMRGGVGSGYLKIGGQYLAYARRSDDSTLAPSAVNGSQVQIPTLLDAWGHPILMWTRNEVSGRTGEFGDIAYETAIGSDGKGPAWFYWWTHAGFLGAPSQESRSIIGTRVRENQNPGGARKPILRSLNALLGHPDFPSATVNVAGSQQPRVPIAGRGDMILQSAGRDSVFLRRGVNANGNPIDSLWYPGQGTPPAEDQAPPDGFDDIVVSVN